MILFVIVLGLLVMKGGVRVLAPKKLVRGYAKLDPELGIHIAPNFSYLASYNYGGSHLIRTNVFGFRMNEPVDFSPDQNRILVYGDSFTFGWDLNYDNTYFTMLKEAAETANPSIQL